MAETTLGESHETARLLRRCERGDPAAWAELVARYQRLVFSIAKRTGLSDEDAEDVFQATFVALHRSLDRIESPGALPKWLAVTSARESYRARRIAGNAPLNVDAATLEEVVAQEEIDAEEEAVRAVRADALRLAADALPGRCRELVRHLYFEESSYQELSEAIGIPIGAIGPTRARCLEKLRRLLEEAGFFEHTSYHQATVGPSSPT